MSSNISGYFIIINSAPVKDTRFTRMKNYIRGKIANLLYAIRNKASKIIINGKPVVAHPDDVPVEFKQLSAKQLTKLKAALSTLVEDAGSVNDRESRLSRPGVIAPVSTPRNEVDDAEIEITCEYGNHDDDIKKPNSACEESEKSAISNGHKDEEECANLIKVSDIRLSPVEECQEIPFEQKRFMRRNRPKAARGERFTTVIPPYINIDENFELPSISRRKKRPAAAKGRRKMSNGCSDLLDLPTDVLVERFKDSESKPKSQTKIRPQAAKGRKQTITVDLSGVLSSAQEEYEVAHVDQTVEDNDSLDELLVDLGISTTRKAKKLIEVKSECVEIDELEAEEDDSSDDIFNVPYLPKSQRKHQNGRSFRVYKYKFTMTFKFLNRLHSILIS